MADDSIEMSGEVGRSELEGNPTDEPAATPAEDIKIDVADGEDGEGGGIPGSSSFDSSGYSGYLYKMTRDGRWQRRWFETNGAFLTYYKSRKREKLLAALSLPQVGEIDLKKYAPNEEKKPGTFTMELQARVYTLRARNDEEAMLWIKILRKIKASKPDELSTTLSPLGAAAANDFRDSVFDSRGSAASDASSTRSTSAASTAGWDKQSKSKCCPCF